MPTNGPLGIDVGYLQQVARDPSPYQRMKLGRELAVFVTDLANPEAEREAVLPILLTLANDAVPAVRRAIAEEVQLSDHVPPNLIFAIAADDDDIALPFLANCPSLNEAALLAVVSIGDEARQCAVARRAQLPRKVLATLLKSGSSAVCRAVLANPAIKLPVEAYRLIMNRFSSVTAICEALRRRPDLPVEIRVRLAQINNDRVKVVLVKQGWVDEARLDEMLAEAEDHSYLQIGRGLDETDLVAMVRYLLDHHLISGTLICRAICHGEFAFVAEALAQIAEMPARHIWSVLATRNHPSLQAICLRANLPEPCALLLHHAMESGAADGELQDPSSFASVMVDVLISDELDQSPETRAQILSLIGAYGPEEVREKTRRLAEALPRAA